MSPARALARRLLREPALSLRAMLRWQATALRHHRAPAPLYTTMDAPDGLRVHLGAGEINLQGWVNVDARDLAHVHVRTTSLGLQQFSDGAVAVIYMCHVLEHVPLDEVVPLLAGLRRKMVPDGRLLVSVPDFDALVRIYEAHGRDLERIKHALMGGQGYEHNFHRAVFNHASLRAALESAGYEQVEPWSTMGAFGRELGDWSSAVETLPAGGRVALSLNLAARNPIA